mmetsp:Transcript_115000/g.264135  ORF Transcript_115000/g.264135 Transcript_115000/m.264135 type:complete len:488 (+) Transcript_115000:117-1580(+)
MADAKDIEAPLLPGGDDDGIPVHPSVKYDMLDCSNVPRSWWLAISTLGKSAVNFVTPLAAMFMLMVSYERIQPRCYLKEGFRYSLCMSSGFAFWTFPVLAAQIVVLSYFKNLLDSRLFYRCMDHSILIEFELFEDHVMNSPLVTFTLVYGAFGLLTVFMHDDGFFLIHILRSLTYLVPIGTFFFLLYMNWTVSGHLVTMPQLYEKKPTGMGNEWLRNYMAGCSFLTEAQLVQGLHRTYPAVANQYHDKGTILSMEQYLGKLLTMALRADPVMPRDYDGYKNLTETRNYIDWAIGKQYFAFVILFTRFVDDDRNFKFKLWAVTYMFWMVLLTMLMALLFVIAAATFLQVNHVPDDQNPWIALFSLIPHPVQGAEEEAETAAAGTAGAHQNRVGLHSVVGDTPMMIAQFTAFALQSASRLAVDLSAAVGDGVGTASAVATDVATASAHQGAVGAAEVASGAMGGASVLMIGAGKAVVGAMAGVLDLLGV